MTEISTGKTSTPYDLAVIGSGPGGYRAAVLAALRGLQVAIIEESVWGGCCLNRGCVPKKDWYHSARLVAAQETFRGRGISGTVTVDPALAWDHQHHVVNTVRESYLQYLKHLKIDTYAGHARFAGPDRLCIESEGGEHWLTTHNSIIATGSHPFVPKPFEEIEDRVLTSDTLFTRPLPRGKRVLIVGSGVIATEFAFILRMLGFEVQWLVRSGPLAGLGFSPQALLTLRSALLRHEIEPRQVQGYTAVDVHAGGVEVTTRDQGPFSADWILLGTGRVPHTTDLGLETIGVETDSRGFIMRDRNLRTSIPKIYAIGDVAGDWMTANHALADAKVAVDNILGGNREQDGRFVPVTVYSAVEMARIGLNEDMAEDAGHEPAVGFAAFETSPRALGQDDTEGFVRLLGDMDSGEWLGGEVIGGDAGELVHLLSLAPDRQNALAWLARGTWNHPARAEEFLNATETLAAKWHLEKTIFGT
jgi:dihydrolipoamide dehydrogenase